MRLKLHKTFWMVIAIGVFVIALTGLAKVHFEQSGEQKKVNEQLGLAQSRLSELPLEELFFRQSELAGQLSQTTSQFNEVNAIISQPISSINISNTFFDVAKTFGLEVTELTSTTPTIGSLEGLNCLMITLTATVKGEVSNIVNFITGMNFYLKTGTIKSTIITIPEAASGDNASANIQLVVYNYQGD